MTECVVFIVGEGPSDIGWLANEPSYRPGKGKGGKPPATTGFVPPVVQRVAEEWGVRVALSGRKLAYFGKADPAAYLDDEGAERSALRALTQKALGATKLAETEGADAVVFVADADRTAGQKRTAIEGKRRWRAVHEAVENGLEQGSLPYVVGVPLRMVESWALGDADALEQVAGRSVSLPGGSPELLWGAKRDDGSNYPKHVLQRALDDEPNAEVFAQIASAADLDVIANRCPVSFAPFLNALRSTASTCTTVP